MSEKVTAIVDTIRRTLRHHGTGSAAYDILIRSLNKCVYFRTLQCLVIDQADKQSLALPRHLRFVKLEEQELYAFARIAEYEIQEDFVRQAMLKGDQCHAILDGNILASYGWYSRRPTLTNSEDLILDFDKRYIYMYKAFTLERYRGQRLHAIGVTRSLAGYQALGIEGLLCYVESNNFDSLKSSYRMGYRNCGRIRVMRIAGKYLIWAASECEKSGITISRNPSTAIPLARAASPSA